MSDRTDLKAVSESIVICVSICVITTPPPPPPRPPRGPLYSDFFHHRLICLFPELHKMELDRVFSVPGGLFHSAITWEDPPFHGCVVFHRPCAFQPLIVC